MSTNSSNNPNQISFYHNQVNVLSQFEQFNMVSVIDEIRFFCMIFFHYSVQISVYILLSMEHESGEFQFNVVFHPDGF